MVDITQINYNWVAAEKRQQSLVGSCQHGVILIADISGYTGLLTQADLTHAVPVVRHVIERVFTATTPVFIVNEIEGDALFTYAPEPPQGEKLFGATLVQLEAYADAFYHAMDELRWSNLRNDPKLRSILANVSMKFIVHYGAFELYRVGNFFKLVGPDVILAHRLLKNAVPGDSYFLFTKQFLDLDEDMGHAKSMAHVVDVKHFGTVDVGFRTFQYQVEHETRHGQDHEHLTKKDLTIEERS